MRPDQLEPERMYDRKLARYEREVDRADAERAALERMGWEDDDDLDLLEFLRTLPEAA